MSYAQWIEEQDYSLGARFDRFDGFDRGDADRDPAADADPDPVVLARQRCAAGRLVLRRWDLNDGPWFCLDLDGRSIHVGDDEAEARQIARGVIAGEVAL